MSGLWFRWSLRDLRLRWRQVVAISLIVAVGSGLYSGLSSSDIWRRQSYDASYSVLRMHDLRASLAAGGTVPEGSLAAAARSVPTRFGVAGIDERLIGSTQVDASSRGQTILVPGRLVGSAAAATPTAVDGVAVVTGRRPAAQATASGLLERHFARHYHLDPAGTVRLSGGGLRYTGQGLSPEYFTIIGPQNDPLAEANFAVFFVPLPTAQAQLKMPGKVNDLVVTLKPGTNQAAAEAALRSSLAKALPGVGITVTTRAQDPAYQQIYRDVDGDQRLYTVFAVLVLAIAGFATFNLVSRVVTAQRREIGIGMSLGAPPRTLAVRPLLLGVQVALLGAVFGIAFGLLVDRLMHALFLDFQPLPIWRTPFQPGIFGQGASLGLLLPIVASALPVWRAVRITPLEATRPGVLTTGSSRFGRLLGRVPLPGRSLAKMPVRNVLRTPRRSLLTLFGVAGAIAIMIGSVGLVDSFLATIDRASTVVGKDAAQRLVTTTDYLPITDPRVAAVRSAPGVGRSSVGLQLGGTMTKGKKSVDTLVELIDFRTGVWSPPLTSGKVDLTRPSVVLSAKAASDLHVRAGDTISFRHPMLQGGKVTFRTDPVLVSATDALPSRFTTFMDYRFASYYGLQGIVNRITVMPKAGVPVSRLTRELFSKPGVLSVAPVSSFTDTVRDALQQRLGIMKVVEVAVLVLAVLITFNSSSISVDERRREQATMFAYGVPVDTVLVMAVAESALIGVPATLLGIGLGRLLLEWLLHVFVAPVLPELGIVAGLSTGTILTAIALGTIATVTAPLLVRGRLRHMNIPATLRVVE